MPAPVTPLIGFVLGAALSWAAAEELARAPSSTTSRSFLIVALFGIAVFAPAAAFFLAFAPDWSYAYLIDSQRLPGAIGLALVLVDAASVPAGFLAAARWARARRLSVVLRLVLGPVVVAGLLLLSVLPRLGVHATYAQYHGDFGIRPLSGSPLGHALLWMLIVLGAAALWTARSVRMLGQPARD
jgi:hypothetical protein